MNIHFVNFDILKLNKSTKSKSINFLNSNLQIIM